MQNPIISPHPYPKHPQLNSAFFAADCKEGFLRIGENCYIIVSTPLGFNEAENHCSQFGGATLAVVSRDDIALQEALASLEEAEGTITGRVWIGLHDLDIEGN